MPRTSLLLILLIGASIAHGAPGGAQSYSETERVTVIDLPVTLRSASKPDGPVQKTPNGLSAEDFEILVDRQIREAVAMGAIAASGPLPLQVLIYVDTALPDQRELEDSVELIASGTPQLARSATVSVAFADPDPRYLLQNSTDPKVVDNLLASTSWQDVASDELRGLRAGFLGALSDTETEIDLVSLQIAFALEEDRLIQQRLDQFLSFVAGHPLTGQQHVLLVVGLQLDLDPMSFYGSWSDDASAPESPPLPAIPTLEASMRDLAANLGGLGWITYPIVPPERESPLRPGLRIGKWRVAGPAGGRVIGLRLAHEEERDPELARGHLENARALLQQGDAVAAEEAFRLALHHFYGDSRTASEQAEATAGLAQALEAQGRSVKARSALRTASDLDSGVATVHPEALAALQNRAAGLELLAAETSGRLLGDPADLEGALADLGRRLRLSIQLAGAPTGELYPVEVRLRRQGVVAHSPRWIRFGASPGVSAARARLLHDEEGVDSPLVLDAIIERLPQDPQVAGLRFHLPTTQTGEDLEAARERACRLTLTILHEEELPSVEQQPVACTPTDGGLEGDVEVSLPVEAELVGILIEDLASGDWGAGIFEIADL